MPTGELSADEIRQQDARWKSDFELKMDTLIRNDEDMTLGTSMNIGLHPTFGNARLFVTVCDNFLINPNGKLEFLHRTPRKIFEL